MSLRGKSVLITAGPTWVPIDDIRIISNISSGETGILLAKKALRLKARVTLLLGPVGICRLNKSIKLIRFKFFDELRNKLRRELASRKYDIVIHAGAVSDFKPNRLVRGKIDSARACNLKLLPLPKMINDIRRSRFRLRLVIFKLESKVSDGILIREARQAQLRAGADFVVANRLNPYKAFIIDSRGKVFPVSSKKELADKLLKNISSN